MHASAVMMTECADYVLIVCCLPTRWLPVISVAIVWPLTQNSTQLHPILHPTHARKGAVVAPQQWAFSSSECMSACVYIYHTC
jgi:hypothetical protein